MDANDTEAFWGIERSKKATSPGIRIEVPSVGQRVGNITEVYGYTSGVNQHWSVRIVITPEGDIGYEQKAMPLVGIGGLWTSSGCVFGRPGLDRGVRFVVSAELRDPSGRVQATHSVSDVVRE